METVAVDRNLAARVLSIVDKGLVKGMGKQKEGQMCVEAAVCFALGLPHSDSPPCVGGAVRSFKISLNDSAWSSNEARTKGMRRLAIAQLGSNEIDQAVFVKELTLQTIKQIVPFALRAAASMEGNAKHKDALEAAALECEREGTKESARKAQKAAADAADADAAAAAYAAAYAAADADAAAAYAAAAAAADAAAAAAAHAAAAAYAAAYAAAAKTKARDKVLNLMAEIGVAALQKAGSPGCQWLDLCEAA